MRRILRNGVLEERISSFIWLENCTGRLLQALRHMTRYFSSYIVSQYPALPADSCAPSSQSRQPGWLPDSWCTSNRATSAYSVCGVGGRSPVGAEALALAVGAEAPALALSAPALSGAL